MTRAEMVAMLRIHLNDEDKIGWEFDDELIDFLDRSAAFLTNILITMKHNSLIKPITISGETELPADFVAFVGRLPIQVYGGVCKPYGRLDINLFNENWDDPNHRKRHQTVTWRSPDAEADLHDDWDDITTNNVFNALYWSRLPYISSFADDDVLPYSIEFGGQIVDVARMLALNKNEYDLTQDVSLFDQVRAALGAVVRGDEQ